MGGINHQPCKHYLPESTKLSRSMSLARSAFELANVGLEDCILIELDGGRHTLEPMLACLSQSRSLLKEMRGYITALREKMSERHFRDLPSIDEIDFVRLGERLVNLGMVGAPSWQDVMEHTKQGGFRNVLDELERRLSILEAKTAVLHSEAENLARFTEVGTVHVVLEDNLQGNIKVSFATLYAEWAQFQGFFLASSLSSTEQWYVFMGTGSLVGEPVIKPRPPHPLGEQIEADILL